LDRRQIIQRDGGHGSNREDSLPPDSSAETRGRLDHRFRLALVFWRHDWIIGLLILFVPSVIVTVLLVTHANLEWLRQSAFGLYMTPRCS
jgi:hypothetical protein